MEYIEMNIECNVCSGTGLYQGIGESPEIAVICNKCNGTGEVFYSFKYNKFTRRKQRTDIKRVYKSGYGYKIGLGKINFPRIHTEIDMDKEGISYDEFINGKMPNHIEKLACPMMAEQSKCHEIKGFTERCHSLHGGFLSYIPDCNNKSKMKKCWEIFNAH